MCQHWSEMWEKMKGAKSTDVFQTATNTTIMHHVTLANQVCVLFEMTASLPPSVIFIPYVPLFPSSNHRV